MGKFTNNPCTCTVRNDNRPKHMTLVSSVAMVCTHREYSPKLYGPKSGPEGTDIQLSGVALNAIEAWVREETLGLYHIKAFRVDFGLSTECEIYMDSDDGPLIRWNRCPNNVMISSNGTPFYGYHSELGLNTWALAGIDATVTEVIPGVTFIDLSGLFGTEG